MSDSTKQKALQTQTNYGYQIVNPKTGENEQYETNSLDKFKKIFKKFSKEITEVVVVEFYPNPKAYITGSVPNGYDNAKGTFALQASGPESNTQIETTDKDVFDKVFLMLEKSVKGVNCMYKLSKEDFEKTL